MIDKWFSTIQLPLTFEQFERLPQNRAYKYEYCDSQAWLTPRPKAYHAMLDLQACTPAGPLQTRDRVTIRPLRDDDWEQLPPVFTFAIHRVQPFASLDDDTRLVATRECLQAVRDGEEGPLITEAGHVAAHESDDGRVGALLSTLYPSVYLAGFALRRWKPPRRTPLNGEWDSLT